MSQDPRPFIRRKAADVLQRLQASVEDSKDSAAAPEASQKESCA